MDIIHARRHEEAMVRGAALGSATMALSSDLLQMRSTTRNSESNETPGVFGRSIIVHTTTLAQVAYFVRASTATTSLSWQFVIASTYLAP
jgi:hypothetical protein